jgi:hypothetical protein
VGHTRKTTLLKSIIVQDILNGHGVFFLDPHGDAIDDLQKRIPSSRQNDVIVLDPTQESATFGLNLLACANPSSLTQREDTFGQALDIFTKLYANPQTGHLDVWLDKYLRNSFYPLIANQGYTLSEIPLFLLDRPFRDRLLQHPAIDPEVVRFWQQEFARLPMQDQQNEIGSTLTRLNAFTRPYIRHIVGQSETTLDFTKIMDEGKILFVKLSATLSDNHKRIIGTMLISTLVHAVLQRERLPEHERRHFCIFVDEFQNFTSSSASDDFSVLFAQARKYAIATTIAHQNRFGQFAGNRALLGATDAAGNKMFFQTAVNDAQEQAPTFAESVAATDPRREAELVISPHAVEDIWDRGHSMPYITLARDVYFWIVDLPKQKPNEKQYIFDPTYIPAETLAKDPPPFAFGDYADWEYYAATPDMVRRGLRLLNEWFYGWMQRRYPHEKIAEQAQSEQVLQIMAQNERGCHQRQCSYGTHLFSHLREAMNHPKGLCQHLS